LGQDTIVEFVAPEDTQFPAAVTERCALDRGDGGIVSTRTSDLAATLGCLLDWSRSTGTPLAEMAVRQPNLEDVFLSLTGRRLRS
jgi:ABC-2 type transport system ATP-binding protein